MFLIARFNVVEVQVDLGMVRCPMLNGFDQVQL